MIPPQKFKELLQEGPGDIIDVRTRNEYNNGHLKKTDYNYDMSSSDFEENVEKLDKDKNYFLYCRTGARSGRATQMMKRKGFENVYQLHGGIATYGKHDEVKGQLWDGKMYVFDERISVPINQVEHVVVGRDYFDHTPCERYVNCANPMYRIIISPILNSSGK